MEKELKSKDQESQRLAIGALQIFIMNRFFGILVFLSSFSYGNSMKTWKRSLRKDCRIDYLL